MSSADTTPSKSISLHTIHVINGPNLHNIGQRQPEIYGNQSFDVFFKQLQQRYSAITLRYYQSHEEGALIAYFYAHDQPGEAFVFNPGAYAHTSLALADAIASVQAPCIEVHISNIFARDQIRQHSYIAAQAQGLIVGCGLQGYDLAIARLLC